MAPKSHENPSVRLHSALPRITDPEFPLGSWLHGCLGVKTQSVCLWHQAKRLHFLSPARPLLLWKQCTGIRDLACLRARSPKKILQSIQQNSGHQNLNDLHEDSREVKPHPTQFTVLRPGRSGLQAIRDANQGFRVSAASASGDVCPSAPLSLSFPSHSAASCSLNSNDPEK